MALISPEQLTERRALAAPGGALGGLYESLAGELESLLDRPLYMPDQKALLSREGGRCSRDGTALEFDPESPHVHRCPACGATHEGELHHRAWITWYQLWLAERAVHAALFHALRGEERHATLASDILEGYAERYFTYPNVDNVLGPTRLFFSTYLESIWLLQLCVATELLGARAGALRDRVRDRVAEPARRLIAEFDEGHSNRQVWNNAALLAAASLCGDATAARDAVHASSGLVAHLRDALLPDGSWYEGENYHQFALRGLWYGVALAEGGGIEIPSSLLDRFHRAFVMPFATALPDFTMPSRKDSQYAVSLRQWRLAELTELGFARTGNPALAAALARCYEPGHPRRETGRARSTADAERNAPSGALTREDLSWRALLFAAPALPDAPPALPRSAHLAAQGYAVFRRDDGIYVGFDYGQSGGGHGHPDRLNLTLHQHETRWLDDLGTGSYVDPSLHWYRSTLAHNAPLVNGKSQPPLDGVLKAYDEREGMGWAVATLDVPTEDARLERAIMVATDYLVDDVSWTSGIPRTRVDLPLHLDGRPRRDLAPAELPGERGLEDGFEFVTDVHAVEMPAGRMVRIDAARDGRALAAHVVCTIDATLYRASAPGQPAAASRPFFVVRANAPEGRIRTVMAWGPAVNVRELGGTIDIACGAHEVHRHRRDDAGWHVELLAGGARSSIDLAGFVQEGPRLEASDPEPPVELLPRSGLREFELGEHHYRRSELSWKEAGSPAARITIGVGDRTLAVSAAVRAGDAVFPAVAATNPYDNEHPDTLGAGMQLYLRCAEGTGAWSLVPEGERALRVRTIGTPGGLGQPTGEWVMRAGDYLVSVTLPLPPSVGAGEPFDIDVYINETTVGRARRRGQLVLSGARGQWVYLRGDRHDDTRWVRLRLA